jgi:hypothetical protein
MGSDSGDSGDAGTVGRFAVERTNSAAIQGFPQRKHGCSLQEPDSFLRSPHRSLGQPGRSRSRLDASAAMLISCGGLHPSYWATRTSTRAVPASFLAMQASTRDMPVFATMKTSTAKKQTSSCAEVSFQGGSRQLPGQAGWHFRIANLHGSDANRQRSDAGVLRSDAMLHLGAIVAYFTSESTVRWAVASLYPPRPAPSSPSHVRLAPKPGLPKPCPGGGSGSGRTAVRAARRRG